MLTDRYELVDGEVISKMGQNPPHATAIGLLSDWLGEVFGAPYVRVQLTSDVGTADPEHNEPEPDVAVTREPRRAYVGRHPGPEDLLLVAEVSDRSLRFDLTRKAALYAAAGYPEYWVLDLNQRRVVVHRDPDPRGYQQITAYSEDETAAPLARPEARVRVGDLMP